jgi:hypothetical protein
MLLYLLCGSIFGLDNYHPEKPDETNEVKLLTFKKISLKRVYFDSKKSPASKALAIGWSSSPEFYQLVAMIEHLQDMGYISRFDEKEIDKIKIEKIQKVYYYMDVSKQFGFIDNKEE